MNPKKLGDIAIRKEGESMKMKRTKKLQDLADSLSEMCFGEKLSKVHKKKICIQCKKKVEEFQNDESRMEYEISGLGACCQSDILIN